MSANNLIRGRVPGQTIMSEVVALQRATPQRSGLKRFFGVSPLAKGNRALYLAALGELTVGDALDSVGPEWDVLHVIPVGGPTPYIDHLVIGPPGVFSLSTRNFAGQEIVVDGESLSVGGRPVSGIAEARAQADLAAGLLTDAAGTAVLVEPIIVIVDPKKLTIRNQPDGVTIVSSKQLLRGLTRMQRVLDGADVARVSDISDRESTWHSSAEPVDDPQQLHRDFTVLREEIASASFVRVAWAAIAFVAVAAGLWTTIALVFQRVAH
jgi:hypothetical protein